MFWLSSLVNLWNAELLREKIATMRASSVITTLFASIAPVVLAVRPPLPVAPEFNIAEVEASQAAPIFNSTFQQYIDHDHPELGTFSQRYWYNSQYWSGPGAPVGSDAWQFVVCSLSHDWLIHFQVVLFTPGEIAADQYIGYLTNATITGLYAQEIDGAVVMLERQSIRYYHRRPVYLTLS
jgi:hypothetical protein